MLRTLYCKINCIRAYGGKLSKIKIVNLNRWNWRLDEIKTKSIAPFGIINFEKSDFGDGFNTKITAGEKSFDTAPSTPLKLVRTGHTDAVTTPVLRTQNKSAAPFYNFWLIKTSFLPRVFLPFVFS